MSWIVSLHPKRTTQHATIAKGKRRQQRNALLLINRQVIVLRTMPGITKRKQLEKMYLKKIFRASPGESDEQGPRPRPCPHHVPRVLVFTHPDFRQKQPRKTTWPRQARKNYHCLSLELGLPALSHSTLKLMTTLLQTASSCKKKIIAKLCLPSTTHHSNCLNLDIVVDGLLLESAGGDDVLDRLVRELQVLLEGDRVLNTERDQRRGDDQGAAKQTPLQMVSTWNKKDESGKEKPRGVLGNVQ